jgi:peptidoglycan/xylan/chitin deacetylase (PgdA/CDA1 family)
MGDFRAPGLTGRRALLLGLTSGVLAAVSACAVPAATVTVGTATPVEGLDVAVAASPGPTVAEQGSPEQGVPEQHVPEPTRSVPSTPVVVHAPTKAQLVAEFGGRRPTEWGLAVTGVVTRCPAPKTVITLDACGGASGSGVDQQLLSTLRKLNVPATLFVNERWIQANPTLTAELAHDPLFELANHGFRHRPLSVNGKSAYGIPGTADVGQVYDEVMENQKLLQDTIGHAPQFFRSGTAFYDEIAAAVTLRLGLLPVNFTINGDGGATFGPSVVAAEVGKARGGDIVIAHFNRPGGGTAAGFAQALPRLLGQGATFAKLGGVLPP